MRGNTTSDDAIRDGDLVGVLWRVGILRAGGVGSGDAS